MRRLLATLVARLSPESRCNNDCERKDSTGLTSSMMHDVSGNTSEIT